MVEEEQEEERFQTPSPGPSLTSTPVKEQSLSLLLNALRSLPSSSCSPTLTPRKSLVDLLNINQNVLDEEEKDKIIVVPPTPAPMSSNPQVSRTGRMAGEVEPDSNGGLPCQECTFVANPFARMDYLKKDNMLLNDTGDHQGEEEVPPGAGL